MVGVGTIVMMALAGGQSVTMRMNVASTLLFPLKPDDTEAWDTRWSGLAESASW